MIAVRLYTPHCRACMMRTMQMFHADYLWETGMAFSRVQIRKLCTEHAFGVCLCIIHVLGPLRRSAGMWNVYTCALITQRYCTKGVFGPL